MTPQELKQKRLNALEDYLKDIKAEQGEIHHAELKSICERGYKYSYATGRVIAKRIGLIVK